MRIDRRRPRITYHKRWISLHRLVLAVSLLVLLSPEIAFSLSQTNVGSLVRDDLLGASALRSDAITGANVSGNNDNNSDHLPKGSIPQSTKFQPNNLPIKRGYWCEYCSVGFNKRKSYLEHVTGKRHKAVVAEGDLAWEDYLARGTDSVFWDTSVTQMDVAKAWSLDVFAEGLRARGRSSKKKVVGRNRMVGTLSPPSLQHHTGNNANGGGGNQIDPTLRLGDLAPSKCGALFRYLHTTTSGIQCLPDVVEALPPVYVRIKELLESIEVYHQFRELIRQRGSRRGQSRRLSRVYDIGCGHGLVGMLIAASCPHIEVVSIDIVPRESFVAQKEAFRVSGRPLTNLKFEAGDLSMLSKRLKVEEEDGTNEHALVLCVHGCKELTHESIELAREHEFAWLALPCCLQEKDHLSKGSLKIKSDATRYAMLCGVLAANHDPEVVTTIDSRITGRNIVLASAGGKG